MVSCLGYRWIFLRAHGMKDYEEENEKDIRFQYRVIRYKN